MNNFERGSHDTEMSDAIDFVVDCVSKSTPSYMNSSLHTLVWSFCNAHFTYLHFDW